MVRSEGILNDHCHTNICKATQAVGARKCTVIKYSCILYVRYYTYFILFCACASQTAVNIKEAYLLI